MVKFFIGQEVRHTKYPRYLFFLGQQMLKTKTTLGEKRFAKKEDFNSNHVSNQWLFDANKIVFPRLHIKLGLMKQHVKASDKKRRVFILNFKCFSSSV